MENLDRDRADREDRADLGDLEGHHREDHRGNLREIHLENLES